jgi:hypothetical protein
MTASASSEELRQPRSEADIAAHRLLVVARARRRHQQRSRVALATSRSRLMVGLVSSR